VQTEEAVIPFEGQQFKIIAGDTPGLKDAKTQEKCGEEIRKALEKSKEFGNALRLIFFFTLESGRVDPDDVATMQTVLGAIKSPAGMTNQFGIVINKIPKLEYEWIMDEPVKEVSILDCIFPNDEKSIKTSYVHWIVEDQPMHAAALCAQRAQESGQLVPAVASFPQGLSEQLRSFVFFVPPMKVEAVMELATGKLAEMKEEMKRQVQAMEHQAEQFQRTLEDAKSREAEIQAQRQIEKQQLDIQCEEIRKRHEEYAQKIAEGDLKLAEQYAAWQCAEDERLAKLQSEYAELERRRETELQHATLKRQQAQKVQDDRVKLKEAGHKMECTLCYVEYRSTSGTTKCPLCENACRGDVSAVPTFSTGFSLILNIVAPGHAFIAQGANKLIALAKSPITSLRASTFPLTDPAARLCAKLANEAYKKPSDRRGHSTDEAFNGFRVIQSLNNSIYRVAYSDDQGNLIVSYRGTDFKGRHWPDFLADIKIATLGLPASETAAAFDFFKQAFAQTESDHPKSGCRSIRFTGHSLGGAIAQVVARRIIAWRQDSRYYSKLSESHVFNPATIVGSGGGQLDRDIMARILDGRLPVTVHRVVGDAVSAGVYSCTTCIDYHPKFKTLSPMERHQTDHFL
jgi:hypothetical protein